MTVDELARLIRNPSIEYRPELRWWLAEGLHTDETLRHEIDSAYRLGFGGMEFLAMDEEAIDHSRYGWGAEEWVHDSQIVVEETRSEEHTSELQSHSDLVCRLLLEKKNVWRLPSPRRRDAGPQWRKEEVLSDE